MRIVQCTNLQRENSTYHLTKSSVQYFWIFSNGFFVIYWSAARKYHKNNLRQKILEMCSIFREWGQKDTYTQTSVIDYCTREGEPYTRKYRWFRKHRVGLPKKIIKKILVVALLRICLKHVYSVAPIVSLKTYLKHFYFSIAQKTMIRDVFYCLPNLLNVCTFKYALNVCWGRSVRSFFVVMHYRFREKHDTRWCEIRKEA